MTSAAEKTATFVGGSIAGGASKAGAGTVEGIYTVTIATTLDWVILSDFEEIYWVDGYTTSSGAYATPYVDSSVKNKVYVTTTGATTLLVKGKPATV